MKTIIQNLIEAMQARIDYLENNTDYTSNFDILLSDDSVYNSDNWDNAIRVVSGVNDDNDWLEYTKQAIIDNPTYYCDIMVHVQGFPHKASDKTAASFCIGEIEEQFNYSDFGIDENSSMLHLYIQYLKDNTDWYWVDDKKLKRFYAYADYSYSYVGYELKDDTINELFATYKEEQESKED